MKTVVAVVVTYNRLQDLIACIGSLRGQTRPLDGIIVINNGSTDGTAAWLKTQSGLAVITQPNLGGAGGFATGIKAALDAGYDGFWCMDDDCLASPDAIAALLGSPNIGPAIKNCMSVSALDPTELAFFVDRPNRAYRRTSDMTDQDLIYGVASLFNGTLIDARVAQTIGIPDSKLFIWGDEVEYMTRAIKMGFPVVTVPKAVMSHPPAVDRAGIPWPAAWKQYYAVRNQRRVFQNIHGSKYGLFVYFRWASASTWEQLVTKRPNRWYNFLVFAEASTDSLCNYFRKRPDTILTLRLYRYLHRPSTPRRPTPVQQPAV